MTDEAPYWSYYSKPGERRLTERELVDKAGQPGDKPVLKG
jgi:hypothetical protein